MGHPSDRLDRQTFVPFSLWCFTLREMWALGSRGHHRDTSVKAEPIRFLPMFMIVVMERDQRTQLGRLGFLQQANYISIHFDMHVIRPSKHDFKMV